MSTELTINTDTSLEDLMKLTGQDAGSGPKSFLPRLKINRDFEDSNGGTIPPGTYTINLDNTDVYAKTATFRPFMKAYQYQVYDADTNTYPNKTILFKSWSEEALDMKGGVKCSKVTGKAKDKLTKEQVEAQKNIKCYTNIYGTISMVATTADGKEVVIKDEPCLARVTGSAFSPWNDTLDIITVQKRPYFASEIILDAPKREKKGATTYYVPVLKTANKVISYTEADFSLLKKFQDTITFENAPIIESFKKHKGFQETTDAILDDIEDAGFIDMSDGLNDELGI